MEMQEYFAQVDSAYVTLSGPDLEQRLQALLEQSRTEYGAESRLSVAMLSELGAYYRGQGRYEDSVSCFRQALELLRRTGGESSPDYATATNNLAGTYRLMGRYDEAETAYTECLRRYRETLGETHVLYASALNNLGLLSLDRGDLPRAAQLLAKASAVLSLHPECTDEFATSLCNLGALYQKLGRLEEARERLLQAADLYETKLGTATPHYHATLNSLGLVYYQSGLYGEAVDCLERASAAAQALYGPDHRECQAIAKHLQAARQAMGGTL